MTLSETLREMEPSQQIKIGANLGTCYFYIGHAGDLEETLRKNGYLDLLLREVVETRPADEAADPGTTIIMVSGTDRGRFWATDERKGSTMEFGWGMVTSTKDYKYTINMAPVTKKNSQQIMVNKATGKRFIGQSKQYREYEEAAGYFLRPKPAQPISYPVEVRSLFYMPTRRRVDKANLEAAVHDILVKYGILADDNRNIIASTDGSRVYYDKERPRVEITITPLEEDYEQWRE